MGFMQGEKSVFSEEGVRPAKVITCRPTKAGTLLPLAQDRSQSPPSKTIYAIFLLGPRYPGPPTYDSSTPTLPPMTTYVDHPGLPLV